MANNLVRVGGSSVVYELWDDGTAGFGAAAATTTFIQAAAGTTGKSSLNLATGVAPTSPVNGDMWQDGTNLNVRINGATISLGGSSWTGTLQNSQVSSSTTYSNLQKIGTINTGTWQATKIGLAYGGTNADLSATGGTSNVLKQTSAGAAITVGQLGIGDLSNISAYSFLGNTTNASAAVTATTASTSFTPGVAFGGGTTGITYSTQTGSYIRIGPLVFFSIKIILTSKGTSTGNATITGLPYSSNADAGGLIGYYASMASMNGIIGLIGSGNTFVDLYNGGTNASALHLADTNFTNSTEIRLSGTYVAA